MVTRHLSEHAWAVIAERLALSQRELQVVMGIIEDLKQQAIAHRIHISPHTVHTHIERLYRKLDVSSRVQLVVRIMDELHSAVCDPNCDLPPICWRSEAGKCPLRGRQPDSRLGAT